VRVPPVLNTVAPMVQSRQPNHRLEESFERAARRARPNSSGLQSGTPSSRRSFFWRRTPASCSRFAAATRLRCPFQLLQPGLPGRFSNRIPSRL